MKFTREAYLKYVEQVEEEYAALSNCESSLAKDILNKPVLCGIFRLRAFWLWTRQCNLDNLYWSTK